MVYSNSLLLRLTHSLESNRIEFQTKKMFGGICIMVDGKMCLGINGNDLMVRLDPAIYEDTLKRPGCRKMDFTGRPLKGYVFVEEPVLESTTDLDYWINLALEFNPRARSSKKKGR
jgi:TfoX/Sxy family transcriptional regulator of competence genes